MATPQCGSVRADTIDAVVAQALLAAVEPEQLALALAAAEEVIARRRRSVRAAELAVERAHYTAQRANTATSTLNPNTTPSSASPTPPHVSASNPTSSTTGPNPATSPAAAAMPDDSGSTSHPPSSRPASNESPAHTSSPTTSKPKPHNAWKRQHYDATVPTIADRIAQKVVTARLDAVREVRGGKLATTQRDGDPSRKTGITR